MKTTILTFAALLAITLAAPQGNPNDITIVKQEEQNNIGVSGYHYSFEQSDGQQREETAELKNEGTENESIVVKGSFSFVGPDGKTYRVTYTADENGFQPVAEHIQGYVAFEKCANQSVCPYMGIYLIRIFYLCKPNCQIDIAHPMNDR